MSRIVTSKNFNDASNVLAVGHVRRHYSAPFLFIAITGRASCFLIAQYGLIRDVNNLGTEPKHASAVSCLLEKREVIMTDRPMPGLSNS